MRELDLGKRLRLLHRLAFQLVQALLEHEVVGAAEFDPGDFVRVDFAYAARRIKDPFYAGLLEHHADWAGQKGYVATTVGGGCILGVALTSAADDDHLLEAYGVFAAEARDIKPDYTPETVNADGWAATRNAFQALFPTIAVVLCFLHGFLKIRDRDLARGGE